VILDGLLQNPAIWSLLLLLIGALGALAGGALSGIAIGGSQFGMQLATQMGGMFGLLAGAPGIALALLVFVLFG
jgi:hypothetical protein